MMRYAFCVLFFNIIGRFKRYRADFCAAKLIENGVCGAFHVNLTAGYYKSALSAYLFKYLVAFKFCDRIELIPRAKLIGVVVAQIFTQGVGEKLRIHNFVLDRSRVREPQCHSLILKLRRQNAGRVEKLRSAFYFKPLLTARYAGTVARFRTRFAKQTVYKAGLADVRYTDGHNSQHPVSAFFLLTLYLVADERVSLVKNLVKSRARRAAYRNYS